MRTSSRAGSSPTSKTSISDDVAVIGYEIDKIFFPAHDGIGKTIQVDGVSYQVIGVLEERKGPAV